MCMNDRKILDKNEKPITNNMDKIKSIALMCERHWKLFSFAIAMAGAVSCYFSWVFVHGKAEYWGISNDWLNSDVNSIVYELLKILFSVFIFAAVNAIPCWIAIKFKGHKLKGSLGIILYLIFVWVVLLSIAALATNTDLLEAFIKSSGEESRRVIILSFTVTLFGMACGLITSFMLLLGKDPKEQKKIKRSPKSFNERIVSIIAILVLLLGVETFLVNSLGNSMAELQSVYTITTDNYVILGEKDNVYICAPIKSVKDNILTIDVSKHINKPAQSIEMISHRFDRVIVEK